MNCTRLSAHKPVYLNRFFNWKFYAITIKTTTTLVLNADMANIKQLSVRAR